MLRQRVQLALQAVHIPKVAVGAVEVLVEGVEDAEVLIRGDERRAQHSVCMRGRARLSG
jgi:hypothetical protein